MIYQRSLETWSRVRSLSSEKELQKERKPTGWLNKNGIERGGKVRISGAGLIFEGSPRPAIVARRDWIKDLHGSEHLKGREGDLSNHHLPSVTTAINGASLTPG